MTILHPDYDREKFLNSIGRKGYLGAEINAQILTVGFSVKDDWFVDLSFAVKGNASGYIPADLFKLLINGNEEFIGSSIDLSGMGFNAQAYLESSIGISKNITERLRVGGRLKLNQGALNASLMTDRLEIQVNEDYSHALYTDMVMRFNAPVDVYQDAGNMIDSLQFRDDFGFSDVGPSFKNFGMGLDVGAQYKLLDNLTLSASIIDFGYVRWNSQVFDLRANNSFTFDGFDISSVIAGDEDIDSMLVDFGDSVLDSFDFDDTEESYLTGLPTKIYIGGSYSPLKFLGLGLLARTSLNKGVRQSLTFSANLYAGDVLGLHLSYTMINRTFNNMGFGMNLRAGPVQFYTVVDQLPVSWVRFEGGEGEDSFNAVLPKRLDYMNLRFGMNLMFGRPDQKRADQPVITQ